MKVIVNPPVRTADGEVLSFTFQGVDPRITNFVEQIYFIAKDALADGKITLWEALSALGPVAQVLNLR